MRIRGVRLQNFRNIPLVRLDFDRANQFLVGPNGAGKTNLLEAIGFVTALRSFRSSTTRPLVRWETKEARLLFRFEHERQGEVKVEIGLGGSAKKVLLDGERVERFADYVGNFPTVCLSSQDIQLLRGSPKLRRRFLDMAISGVDAEYLVALRTFHKGLASRNALLRKRASKSQFTAFEREMAPTAVLLHKRRTEAAKELAEELRRTYQIISGQEAEKPRLVFKPDARLPDESAYLELLEGCREKDLRREVTTAGPQRDDIKLVLFDRVASVSASEGQQRGLVTALRLAQARWFEKRSGIRPVLLADDVLGEFDPGRRERFWKAVDPEWQVIATGTMIPSGLTRGKWEILEVSAGAFEAKEANH